MTTIDGSSLPPRTSATDRTDVSELPVLDRHILDNLGAELSSRAGALRFAETFVQMLPERVAAVESALTDTDPDAAVVALLSLNASACMVGARQLQELSAAALDRIGGPPAPGLVARLHDLGTTFQSALGGIMR